MPAEQNKVVLHRLINEAMGKGDLGVLDEICAPDFMIESPVIPTEVGKTDGLAAFKRGITAFHAAFPDLQYTLENTVAQNESVAGDYVLHATHTGEFAGFAPTGKKIVSPQLCFAQLTDGKIKNLRFSSYGTPLLAQLRSS